LIGQGIHLHPLAVIVAILAGAELAGVAGIFLAIPVVAILTVSYRHCSSIEAARPRDLLEPTAAAAVATKDLPGIKIAWLGTPTLILPRRNGQGATGSHDG